MTATPPALTAGQRKFLRARAQHLKPVVWVGEEGISSGVMHALDQALEAHELVKVRMRAPEDKRTAAETLARKAGAALCALVGHTVVLYRPHPETPQIPLPAARA